MESAREGLAEQLRRLQELSGHGVRALAREAGISPSSLSRYLIGQTVPPWRSVVELCRVARRDPRPLRGLWEQASSLPAPPKARAAAAPHNDLPRDVPDFTGRVAELASVVDAVRASRIVAIDGMAGVGKTCLAVHAAHQLAAEHPDAQLYIDLHGFTPGRVSRPVSPT